MNKYCFLEISISDRSDDGNKYTLYKNVIIIELFYDVVPKTAENFYSLCTRNSELCYKNNNIFRIVKDSFIQIGDVINNDGTDGKTFNDEFFYDEEGYFDIEKNYLHNEAFLLSTANNGPNTNNSQFIITIEPMEHLDGCNVVFGKVIKGISTLLVINNMPTHINGKLYNDIEIKIVNCGVIENTYSNEYINLKYEKSLCNQILINISNKLKNICKKLNNVDYNYIIQKCEEINNILYNDFIFINDKLICKNNYFKIKISSSILKIICKYKIKNYKNVIIDANILLEIPEKYFTDKNKLQILFYKLKSIYEMDINNEDSLIKSKKILEELYFINNNDVKIFMKELKNEEEKINNLLKKCKTI